MHAHLAATLIVLFGHGTALACENAAEVPSPAQTAPLVIAQSQLAGAMLRTASDVPARVIGPVAADAPALMRTYGRTDAVVRFTPREERPSAPAAAPAAEADADNGATLLLVGLALMAGIAMRRRGAGRP